MVQLAAHDAGPVRGRGFDCEQLYGPPNSEADGVFDREYFRGRPDPLSTEETILYWNQEFRSTIWGHLTLLNLKQLVEPIFTGFAHTTHPHDHPTNADIADHTHDQDGHVNYTHPAHNVKDPYLSAYSAKALPLDVALGKVDSMDVMGSTHQANLVLWYRLCELWFSRSCLGWYRLLFEPCPQPVTRPGSRLRSC